MRTINRDTLEDAIGYAGLDITVRADYSGRAMYGESCFGLVGDERDLLVLFASLGEQVYNNDLDELDFQPAELARAMRADSMGRSSIFYFPGWQLKGPADDVEREEEEAEAHR
jgi:hypothetical protein